MDPTTCPAALKEDTMPVEGTSADPLKTGVLSCWPSCNILYPSTLQSQGHPAWQCLCGCIGHALFHSYAGDSCFGQEAQGCSVILEPANTATNTQYCRITRGSILPNTQVGMSHPRTFLPHRLAQEHRCAWLHCQVLSRVVWKWVFCFQFYLVKDASAKLISCCSALSDWERVHNIVRGKKESLA